jgi:hypothetical protein
VVTLGVLAVAAGRRLTGLLKAQRLRREDATGNTPPAGPPNRTPAYPAGHRR